MAIHNVLDAACKALKADPAPYDSAAKPELHNRMYVVLTVWMTERVRPKLVAARIDEVLADAKVIAQGGKLDKDRDQALRKLGYVDPWKDLGSEVVRSLAMETMECVINNVCGKGARNTAKIAAQLLGVSFLDDLHKEILRLDALTMIERQELPAKGNVTEVYWRGATGAKTTHVVVKLDTGKYGLIAKTKGRWTWAEGERDEILATLPEAQMEGAIDAVVGERSTKTKKPALATKNDDASSAILDDELSGVLAVMTMADGRAWFASKDGGMTTWSGTDVRSSSTKTRVGRVTGIHAAGNLAVTWGAILALWRGTEPEEIGTKNQDVHSAIVVESKVIWATKDAVYFGTKKVSSSDDLVTHRRLLFDGKDKEVVVCSPLGVTRYAIDGKAVSKVDERLAAQHHQLLGGDGDDDDRIALWNDKAKEVTIANLKTAETEIELTLDASDVDLVTATAAAERVMVRYHKGKRVAVFDRKTGKRTHRIQARDVGTKGSAVEDLYPLKRGAVLAFAPYPKGEALLLDLDAQLLQRWDLKKFYGGGKSFFAEDEKQSVFAHTRDSTRALRIDFTKPGTGGP